MPGRDTMKRLLAIPILLLLTLPVRAEFGDADFPQETFSNGPKSYHDAWCRKIKNKCRIRFAGNTMSVEGQGGITSNQFITFKTDEDGSEFYTYITYKTKKGQEQQALFLFGNYGAHIEFLRALSTWRRQVVDIRPNYLMPASQGPQETHGRDAGLNPYENTETQKSLGQNSEYIMPDTTADQYHKEIDQTIDSQSVTPQEFIRRANKIISKLQASRETTNVLSALSYAYYGIAWRLDELNDHQGALRAIDKAIALDTKINKAGWVTHDLKYQILVRFDKIAACKELAKAIEIMEVGVNKETVRDEDRKDLQDDYKRDCTKKR